MAQWAGKSYHTLRDPSPIWVCEEQVFSHLFVSPIPSSPCGGFLLTVWLAWLLLFPRPGTIANGTEPAGPHYDLIFHEDLRIHGPGGGWTNAPVRITVDSYDNAYVISPGGEKIIKYRANGAVMAEYGNRESDPVRFLMIDNLRVRQDGVVEVFGILAKGRIIKNIDGNYSQVSNVEGGFVRYGPNGTYLDAMTDPAPTRNLMEVRFSPDSEMIFAKHALKSRYSPDRKFLKSRSETFPLERTSMFNRDMKIIKNVSVSERPLRAVPYDHIDFWLFAVTESLKVRWNGEGVAAFATDGSVYLANTSKYHITRWQADLKKPILNFEKKYEPLAFTQQLQAQYIDDLTNRLLVLEREDARHKITRQVVAEAFRKSRPPTHIHPLVDLIAVDDQGLLAIREINRRQRLTRADLFRANGHYVGHLVYRGLGLANMTFQNGYAHTIEQGRDGRFFIARYKYTWKKN